MHDLICRLPLRGQFRPLRRRQVASDQVFVDFGEHRRSRCHVAPLASGIIILEEVTMALEAREAGSLIGSDKVEGTSEA
ncbi:hypothetical protein [Bradyrhizobium sp. 164]|uniref:hypothetical protein n=1 Tax=Bradyrhizobium sp. 164 TaxID=2782637 RepID=UPI001FF90546|nr:hypothetical protein [Bradyrhizobium sp. 164]MCK1595563.1 hypothetical protein [Bradyrhizobium sp. 164]